VADDPILEAKGVSKRFGAIAALDSVDLTLRRGESVALFGPNGAGKSTLLRILTRTLRPTSGTIEDGDDAPAIGVVSHQTFLYDDLSARENLSFYARLHGVEKVPARVDALLSSAGLSARADDPVRGFSRGMQQRVALSRALVHGPALLVLDEPFTGLDPVAAAHLRATLRGQRDEGTTLLVATHDLSEGLALSDRWLILRKGRIVRAGSSSELDAAALERIYLAEAGAPS
jgi:heme exporter protein A